jgi:carboxyl-terminal processing protease
MSDGPAESAGVRAGDQIVEIEGESTYGWSVDRAVSVLRGETGSAVNFSVGRPGVREPIAFLVERAPIHVNSIRFADLLSDSVGYVWLESVTEESSAELVEQVNNLRGRGAKSLVLDLRWNPGGVLGQAIAVSDLFLDQGDVVVETRGRDSRSNRVFSADQTESWSEMPLLVLVNGFSASASEIIAGALQDHDRALLVGTPTFGKGLVQSVFPFGRVQALKLTTGRWYTPVGRSIQRMPVDRGQDLDSVLALADPEEYHTEGGRPLKGGGGIHPDFLVEPRELTEAEKAFNDALGSNVQAFRDVLGAYAREWTTMEQVSEEFVTTSAMRAELLRRLRDRGASLPASVWNANADMVSRQFAYQVLRFGLGLDAEMRRRMSDDRVVERALEMLSGIETRDELMRVVPQN